MEQDCGLWGTAASCCKSLPGKELPFRPQPEVVSLGRSENLRLWLRVKRTCKNQWPCGNILLSRSDQGALDAHTLTR